jgi:hypothetical protein
MRARILRGMRNLRRFALLLPLFVASSVACAVSSSESSEIDTVTSPLPKCSPSSTAPICSGCIPKCNGKACGASDGCEGICLSGSCPIGDTCGGTGVPGTCGHAAGDLRYFQTGFRDQAGRDTCTVFAVTAAVEAAYRHQYGLNLDLSEQYLQHAQKSMWLNASALLPAAEIQPETNGGGNVPWQFTALQRWGLPREATQPYVGAASYQALAGWTSPDGTAIANAQRALDDFALSATPLTLLTPATIVTTTLPQAALEDARYRPLTTKTATNADLTSLAWFKNELLAGREVAFGFVGDGAPPPTGAWLPGSGSQYAHAMLIVGFDDAQQIFWVKNQWGSGRFERFAYSWITSGRVYEAMTILTIADPNAPFGAAQNPQLALGRWNLDFDGWRGTLDLYRLGQGSDRRLGTYWGPDGVPRRVNGQISGRRVDLWIDWNAPNQAPSTWGSGNRFTMYLYDGERTTMAGDMTDTGGNHWTATATKGTWLSGVPRFSTLSRESYSGRWELDTDGVKGTLAISCTPAGVISGTFTNTSAQTFTVSGNTTADPRWFSFVIQDGSPNLPFFQGYLNGHALGIMSGFAQKNGTTLGFHALRTGDL